MSNNFVSPSSSTEDNIDFKSLTDEQWRERLNPDEYQVLRQALSALTLVNTPIPLRKVSTAAVRAMPSYFARRRSSPPIVAGRPFSRHLRVTTLLSAKIAL